MTDKTAPTKPETLDIEQLDAAVGGATVTIVPCVKIGIDTSGGSKIKPFSPAPLYDPRG